MTEVLLEEQEFLGMFRGFSESAFRLETQRNYAVTFEKDAFDRYLAGSPLPPSELPWWQSWLDRVREHARQGRRISRVKVIDTPPTDYQAWEIWGTRWHLEAGEDIRYLHRETARSIGIPLADWWLFDDSRVVTMTFGTSGEVSERMLLTDPGTVETHREWRALAFAHALGNTPVAL